MQITRRVQEAFEIKLEETIQIFDDKVKEAIFNINEQ